MTEEEICPNFDFGMIKGVAHDFCLFRSRPNRESNMGVLGLRGEWAELSDPIPNVCEQKSQAKRNLLQRMLSKLEYEARF